MRSPDRISCIVGAAAIAFLLNTGMGAPERSKVQKTPTSEPALPSQQPNSQEDWWHAVNTSNPIGLTRGPDSLSDGDMDSRLNPAAKEEEPWWHAKSTTNPQGLTHGPDPLAEGDRVDWYGYAKNMK